MIKAKRLTEPIQYGITNKKSKAISDPAFLSSDF